MSSRTILKWGYGETVRLPSTIPSPCQTTKTDSVVISIVDYDYDYDDDVDVLRALNDSFESGRYALLLFNAMQQFLESVDLAEVDRVISDVGMPWTRLGVRIEITR